MQGVQKNIGRGVFFGQAVLLKFTPFCYKISNANLFMNDVNVGCSLDCISTSFKKKLAFYVI